MQQSNQAAGRALTHDIVIVGGGLVGASLGCALAPLIERYGWRVAVIESSPLTAQSLESAWQPSFDARASAIAEGSAQHFQQLGVWEAMHVEATPIRRIHISERGRLGATRLSADELGVAALGHVIPNAWMGRVLHRRLAELPLEWHCPATVEQLTPVAGGHYLQLSDGSQLTAGLTVLADGGRSGLKEQLGIGSRREPYEQTALIAHVGVSTPAAVKRRAWRFPSVTSYANFSVHLASGWVVLRGLVLATPIRFPWLPLKSRYALGWRYWVTPPTPCIRWRGRGLTWRCAG